MPRYNRIFIDGTLASGAERWSAGLAFTNGAIAPTSTNLSQWAEAIMTSLVPSTGSPATVKGYYSSSGTVVRVRAYSYPDIGDPADVAGVSTQVPIAGSGTANMPPQCALVVSLLTGVPGKRYRGRFYWPHVGGTVTAGGKSSLVSSTTASAFSGLISNWGTLLPSGDVDAAVVSEAAPAITVVSAVSVGDVIDTQRRRRDGLVETRFNSSVT